MPPADYAEILAFSNQVPEFTVLDLDGRPLCTPHMGGYANAATINREEYTVEAITSTNMMDRWGEIVEPDGWKLKNFRMNPIMLLEHETWGKPIGRSLAEEIRPKGLWQKLQYAPEATEEARDVWALVAAGVYRAFSPGWLPLKWEAIDEKAPINGATKGEGWPPGRQRQGVRFTSCEMLEISQVAIPATPNAVQLSLGRAAISLARKFGQTVPDSPLKGDFGILAQAAGLLDSDPDLQTIFRNAVSFKDTGEQGAAAMSAAEEVKTAAEAAAWKDGAVVSALIEEATCRLMLAGAEIRALR